MEMDKILSVEHLAYQAKDGEQKIYILPDAEAVEKMISKLREGGLSDTIQVSLSVQPQAGQEESKSSALLDDMAARLQEITDIPAASNPMGEVEQLLGQYLAMDGEQKVYVLPEDIKVDQLLSSLTGIRTGEIKQSQMWRKTDVGIDHKEQSDMITRINTCFQVMDKRIRRLEFLLNQAAGQDNKASGEEIK